MAEWISVKKRLPGYGEDVLICYRNKFNNRDRAINISSYTYSSALTDNAHGWREPFQYFHDEYVVVAWMPLPDVPEEEEITETELLDILLDGICCLGREEWYDEGTLNRAKADVLTLFDSLKWHPVPPRDDNKEADKSLYPPEDTPVLACDDKGNICGCVGSYIPILNDDYETYHDVFAFVTPYWFGEVVAWMKAPEPYRRKGKG